MQVGHLEIQKSGVRSQGFTLVELLITIVVIAIIAGIVVATFGGIQRNARNTARIENARQYEKILLGLGASGLGVPQFWSGDLGQTCFSGDLPDINSDGQGDCASAGPLPIGSTYPDVSEAIETLTSRLPSSYPPVSASGVTYNSPMLSYTSDGTIDGQPFNFTLFYVLEGTEQDCIVKVLKNTAGNTFTRNNPDNYSLSLGGLTYCYVALDRLNGF